MPSYRPKSLEELNNMYDKKLAAESAMRNQLKADKAEKTEPVDTTPPAYEPYTYDSSKHSKQTEEPVADISGAVNEFIRTFGQPEEKKPAAQPVQPVHPVQTRVTSKKIPSGAPAKPTASAKKKKPVTPVKKQERTVLVRNDERSDLMDDYKKIMMDEDEDNLSLKERLAMKKKSKAEKKEADKAAKKAHKKSAEEKKNVQPEAADTAPEKQSELHTDEQAEDNIVINSDEISAVAESFINEHIGETVAEKEELTEQEELPAKEQEDEEYQSEADDELLDEDEIEFIDSQEESDSQEDYPEHQEEYEQPEDEQQDDSDSYGYDVAASKKSRNRGRAGRVISMMLLILMLLLTACTGALKYVVNIDTGKAFMDKYYVFTAKERLLYAGISVGDLVISEKKPVGNDDAFVYFDNSSFRFARPSGVSSANSYVIIAENDNEQVLASSENVRGVVKYNIPEIGRILGLVSSNFMVVFIAMAGICLLLIIITAILFAKARKRQLEAEEAYPIDDEYDDEDTDYSDSQEISDDEPYFADTQEAAQYQYDEPEAYMAQDDSENAEQEGGSSSELIPSEYADEQDAQETVYEIIDDEDEDE